MAQVEPVEILRRAVADEVRATEAVAALVDRDAGNIRVAEGVAGHVKTPENGPAPVR